MNSSGCNSRRNTVLTPGKSWISSRGAPGPPALGKRGFGSLGMSGSCGFVGIGNSGVFPVGSRRLLGYS